MENWDLHGLSQTLPLFNCDRLIILQCPGKIQNLFSQQTNFGTFKENKNGQPQTPTQMNLKSTSILSCSLLYLDVQHTKLAVNSYCTWVLKITIEPMIYSKHVIIHKTWVYKIEKALSKTSWRNKTWSDKGKHLESFLYINKSIRAVIYSMCVHSLVFVCNIFTVTLYSSSNI